MPQDYKKYDKPMQDGRRKLNPALHQEIIEKKKSMSSNALALEYKVSVSLIKWIVYQKRRQSMQERNKLVWKDNAIHYGKKYHTQAIRKWRNKKIALGLSYNPSPVQKQEKICTFCGKTFMGFSRQKYCDPSHRWEVYKKSN